MPRKGWTSITIKDETHDLLIDCANRLNRSVPDTVKHLAEGFLAKEQSK